MQMEGQAGVLNVNYIRLFGNDRRKLEHHMKVPDRWSSPERKAG
jgi:hypothetical protein